MLEWCMGGIRFRLSLLFPAAVIGMLSFDSDGLATACLLASLVHELGHFLMMRLCHDTPACIAMGIFGVRVERCPTQCLGYGALCLISLAGPLANVLCGAGLAAMGAWQASLVNGGLAFFNLLPVVSLDGGEALYALLCRRWSEEGAERVLLRVSLAIVFPLAVLGFWMLLASGYNFTLLLLSGYLILRIFLHTGH